MRQNQPHFKSEEFSTSYNNLLSNVGNEFDGNFAALASPTLSKQETVTGLFQNIRSGQSHKLLAPPFPWRLFFQFPLRLSLMFARVVYASVRFRVRTIPEGAVIFRTWLVPRSIVGSTIVDDYFRQLPKDISLHEKVVESFTSTDVGLLQQFGRLNRSDCQIVSYGLLNLLDVVRLLWDYVTTARIKAKKNYFLDGRCVTAYINQSFLLDYIGLRSFEAYAEKYKCQKLVKYKIKSFVYVFENQSWEKVCCSILRKNGVGLIGYQSSGFSPIFLNFFPTEQDACHHPMPDVLLTVGEYFRRYLLENGHYLMPVQTFSALRFSYPLDGNRYAVQAPNLKILGRILYAFSVHIEQYNRIIDDLVHVFLGSGIEVHLKLHPLYRPSDLNRHSKLPSNFKILAGVEMDCLSDLYDCVLFNDNSFGIEALLKGVKSYQYSTDGAFLDDRFMYFDLWQVNYQLADLYDLKESIKSLSFNKNFEIDIVQEYINKMYRPYSGESLDQFRLLLKNFPQQANILLEERPCPSSRL